MLFEMWSAAMSLIKSQPKIFNLGIVPAKMLAGLTGFVFCHIFDTTFPAHNITPCFWCQYGVFTFLLCGVIMTLKGGFAMKNNDSFTRDDQTRFTMRINSELLEKIKAEAEKSKRSTAKQIEFILEQYIETLN